MILLNVIDENLFDLQSLTGWGLVAAMAIYAIYDISTKYLSKKNNNKGFNLILKRLEDQSEINKELLKHFKIAASKYTEEITEDQLDIIWDKTVHTAKCLIIQKVYDIIKENNINNNEQLITNKIRNYIKSLFEEDLMKLNYFVFKGVKIGSYLDSNWINEITSMIIKHLYLHNDKDVQIKQTRYYIVEKFNDIKNQFLLKIKNNND